MTGLREANSKNTTNWTDIFLDAMNMFEVSVDWDPDEQRFILDDLQGVIWYDDDDALNLKTSEQVVDRMSAMAERWITEDYDEEAEYAGLTEFDEFPEGQLDTIEAWDDWQIEAPKSKNKEYAKAAQKFIKDHEFEFQMIDLFCNHVNDVNLDSLK